MNFTLIDRIHTFKKKERKIKTVEIVSQCDI